MQVEVVSKEVYQEKLRNTQYIYNNSSFQELNASKVDKVEYLLFKNKKYRLALTVGVKDGVLKCPYSAPFGIFEKIDKNVKIEYIEESLICLEEYAKKKGYLTIYFNLPPFFYDESFIGQLSNIFYRLKYVTVCCNLNYQILLKEKNCYEKTLARNAIKNFHIAEKNNLLCKLCNNLSEKKEVYQIIKENRKGKGYPLRMSLEQVLNTIGIVENDFFLIKSLEKSIAGAIVFHINIEVVQVIYWGDLTNFSDKKPINYLAYKLQEYYFDKGKKYLDIGPASEFSIPNYGLCDFKESIGCDISLKLCYEKSIWRKLR